MKVSLEKAGYLDTTYDRTIDFKESSENYNIESFEIDRMIDTSTFSFSIKVINSASGLNVSDAEIVLVNASDNSMSFNCETDGNGECSISAIKQGDYSISIMASGYENYSEGNIIINSNLQLTKEIIESTYSFSIKVINSASGLNVSDAEMY